MNKQYIFVSGAAGGIGTETVNYLAQRKFYVFAGDLDKRVLEIFSEERIIPIHVDITNVESVHEAVIVIQKTTNYLNGIVNIAGIFDQFALMDSSPESFKRLIEVNLLGAQVLTGALFPMLKKAKGRVVNLSSETVLAQLPLQSYGFSKKLFDTWNTQLRMELKLLGMNSIVIRAGGHQTPFIEKSLEVIKKDFQNSMYQNLYLKTKEKAGKILSKKQGDPKDLAIAIHKALVAKRPRKVYHVNVSVLYGFLNILPAGIREKLVLRQLKKWM